MSDQKMTGKSSQCQEGRHRHCIHTFREPEECYCSCGCHDVKGSDQRMTAAKLRERVMDADRSAWNTDDVGTKERYRNLAWALEGWADALDQLATLQTEITDEQYVREKLANLLRRTAIVLKGPEPEMIRWDWSSIPEQVQALVAKIAAAEQEIARLQEERDGLLRDNLALASGRDIPETEGRARLAVVKRAEQAEGRLAAVRAQRADLLRELKALRDRAGWIATQAGERPASQPVAEQWVRVSELDALIREAEGDKSDV